MIKWVIKKHRHWMEKRHLKRFNKWMDEGGHESGKKLKIRKYT